MPLIPAPCCKVAVTCCMHAALFRQRRADALGVAFQLLDINGTGSLEFSVFGFRLRVDIEVD